MFLYLTTYFLGALWAFALRHRRQAVLAAGAAFFYLLLLAGGRYEVGCDYRAYDARFYSLYPPSYGWFSAFEHGEGGFHGLNLIARDLGLGFNGVVFLASFVSLFGLWRFSRLATNPLALLVTAFPILVVQLGMSGMRQAAALGVLMLAYVAFTERKRLVTALWVLVAFLFHTSAIVMLPIALLARTAIFARYVFMAVLVVGPIAAWLLGGRLQVYTDRYVDQIYGENSSNGAWIRYFVAAIPFALVAWKRKRVEQAFPRLFPMIWLFAYSMMALAIVGSVSSVALHRLTFYVLPVSLLALHCASECLFKHDARSMARALPLALYGAYFLAWFLTSRHAASCYIPYQSWLL